MNAKPLSWWDLVVLWWLVPTRRTVRCNMCGQETKMRNRDSMIRTWDRHLKKAPASFHDFSKVQLPIEILSDGQTIEEMEATAKLFELGDSLSEIQAAVLRQDRERKPPPIGVEFQ